MDPLYNDKIVIGTAGLAGIWGPVNFSESEQTIHYALEQGISHFDTSPAYADAETILGNALYTWKGTTPFISTKAGKLKSDSPDSVAYDFSPDGLIKSITQSLEHLKIGSIDLLFLHDPSGMQAYEIQTSIDTLQEIKLKGWIKAIGIGGNYGDEFKPFATAKNFDYFMGYNRFNIINQDALQNEYADLSNQNIKIWQASPLYMGLLGRKLDTYIKEPPSWISTRDIHRAMELNAYCKKTSVSISSLALRYVYNNPIISKIVLGASNLNELKQSLDWLNDPSTILPNDEFNFMV
ncbi:MAG: aldo/keto reductase [Sediminibacterium sp.]|jgi:aryl-alcohol dehydrogenase-like predicted oxidoreductase